MDDRERPFPTPLDQVASVISFLADHGLAVALLVGIQVFLGRRRPASAAIALGLVGLPIMGLNALLKAIVNRPRPARERTASPLVREPTSSSFPSGHTLSATTAAVALPLGTSGVALGLGAAGAVGWSRIRLGDHHVGDVLGGAGIGIALGLLLRPVVRWAVRECDGRSRG